MQKLTGIVLIVGTLLFMIAAFMPITINVVTAANPQKQAETLQNNRTSWLLVNVLFGAGSIITVVGLGMFGLQAQSSNTSLNIKLICYLGIILIALGTLFWVIITYNRMVLPPEELAGNLGVNRWMFPAYTVLVQIGLIIVGFVLTQNGYPTWLSWGMLILAGLSLAAYLFFKDMPPFVHYVLLFIMGIALLR